MQPSSVKIWYKQFWPWFLIFVPLCSMVLSFTMMSLAFNGEDSMVIDDYYKEGKGINLSLQKIQQAKALNIQTKMQVSSEYAEVIFHSGEPEKGEALILDFFHSTQKYKDFSVTLLRDANGVYRAPLEQNTAGKWKISLHPINQDWKVQQVISLPREAAFEFNP